MKHWFIAQYKLNEVKRAKHNLTNQQIDYYLPKIRIKKNKINYSEEVLFPGYIFIHSNFENLPLVNYSRGIKNILKFGKEYSCIGDDEISHIKSIEESSKSSPIKRKLSLGQEVEIDSGPFRGVIARVCSLPKKERMDVFVSLLGTFRRINIKETDLL